MKSGWLSTLLQRIVMPFSGKREAEAKQTGELDAALAAVPNKWLVYRLMQTPAFCLWDCVLYEWDHEGGSGMVIECSENDTAAGAVKCCLSRLNGGKRLCSYDCGVSA
jgi:hypothetical protein